MDQQSGQTATATMVAQGYLPGASLVRVVSGVVRHRYLDQWIASRLQG